MNIGKRICKLRKDKKMTQQELADRLFVTDKTISSWELGRTEPSSDLIIKLSEILDCDIGYLVYGNNPKSDVETEIKFKLEPLLERDCNSLGSSDKVKMKILSAMIIKPQVLVFDNILCELDYKDKELIFDILKN